MFESSQKTIKESVQLEGVGLHNGIKVNLSLIPAEANSGITFKRKDIDDSKNIIEANYNNVSASSLCTKITNSSFFHKFIRSFHTFIIFKCKFVA